MATELLKDIPSDTIVNAARSGEIFDLIETLAAEAYPTEYVAGLERISALKRIAALGLEGATTAELGVVDTRSMRKEITGTAYVEDQELAFNFGLSAGDKHPIKGQSLFPRMLASTGGEL